MVGAIRVLHVDDEPRFGELVVDYLEREYTHFTVESAAGADAALARLDDDIDCVVSDYEMPNADGLELLDAVRERYPDLPFILLTGRGSEEVASDAIAAGVTDYLKKGTGPEQFELLATRVENAVAQHRTAAALEDHQQQVFDLMNASPVPIVVYDRQREIQYTNEAAVEFTELESIDDLIGRSVAEFIHPEDRSMAQERTERVLFERESVAPREYKLQTDDGSIRYGSVAGAPLTYRGEPAGQAIINDLTARRTREQTLTALHHAAREIGRADAVGPVYETVIETGEEVLDFDIVVVDVEQDGYLVQEAWTFDEGTTGYYERTSIEDDDTFAIRAYTQGETIVVDDLRDHDITPADSEYRSALTVPIGEFGTFQAVASEVGAFDDRDREFAELLVDHARVKLAQLADKRELRERTDQLERQNERLDEFASVVSHDLRNPLHTMGLSLNMAEQTGDAEHFERCRELIDRMEGLIEDLLTLAREGRDIDERESVSLSEVAHRCWLTVESDGGELTVVTDNSIEADSGRLKQLLENLFRNAMEHAGPDVTVEVGLLEEAAGFYVADDGPGLPENDREQVFEPGYSTSEEGTGFGLAIVEEIAEGHDWNIEVSESASGGARFEFRNVESIDA